MVSRDGSPTGPKLFVMWNPPVIQEATEEEPSPGSLPYDPNPNRNPNTKSD